MNISENQFSKSFNTSERESQFLTPLYLEFSDTSEIPGTASHFKVTTPFQYFSQIKNETITVGEEFPTDFASVPQLLLSIIPRVGTHGKAAVIHDYLCDEAEKSACPFENRQEADDIFLEAMKVLKVSWIIRQVMFRAVQLWTLRLHRPERFLAIVIPVILAILAILYYVSNFLI